MILENKVDVVVMVTNCEEKGRQKCHKYWPNNQTDDMTLLQGAITVSLEGVEEFPDYTIRTLVAKTVHVRHSVKQFHYTSWPDHGVPESTAGVLTVVDKSRAARKEGKGQGPMVVHCSAGVGRTGTLIAIDLNQDRAASEPVQARCTQPCVGPLLDFVYPSTRTMHPHGAGRTVTCGCVNEPESAAPHSVVCCSSSP